jgi:hypothetical protein
VRSLRGQPGGPRARRVVDQDRGPA